MCDSNFRSLPAAAGTSRSRNQKVGAVMSSVTVLVVEDFAPFRQFICSTLKRRPEFQVIGEVSDGFEAIRKAEELQPNLILLDIGLPKLNGIEAARRIHELCPNSKLLFISQESDSDVVQEALSLGALGYVVKTRVGDDFWPALEAVRRGGHFVSSGLLDDHFAGAMDPRTPNRLSQHAADD